MRENSSPVDGHGVSRRKDRTGIQVSFEVSEPPSLWELVTTDRDTVQAPDPPLAPEIEGDTMVTGPGQALPASRRVRRVIVTVVVLACLSAVIALACLIGRS